MGVGGHWECRWVLVGIGNRLESIMLKIFVIILFQNSSQTYYYSIEILCYYAHIMLKNSIISTLFGKLLNGAFKTSSRDLH